jgi:hypothetical protein
LEQSKVASVGTSLYTAEVAQGEGFMPVAPNPTWFDDFLGVQKDTTNLNPAYMWVQENGNLGLGNFAGSQDNTFSRNGYLKFNCGIPDQSSPYFVGIRAGWSDHPDFRNWDPVCNITFECKVYFFQTTLMQSALGLVGYGDAGGFNLLEFYYYENANSTATWNVVLNSYTSDHQGTNLNTGFSHTALTPIIFRLQVSPTTVTAYINDTQRATYTPQGQNNYIPQGLLVPEMNLVSVRVPPQNTYYSQPVMAVDYWYITQTRGYI